MFEQPTLFIFLVLAIVAGCLVFKFLRWWHRPYILVTHKVTGATYRRYKTREKQEAYDLSRGDHFGQWFVEQEAKAERIQ